MRSLENNLAATLLGAVVLLQVSACGVEQPRDCVGDRCETEGSKEELLQAIDGYNDPVARFLRASATEQGTLEGDYRLILDGVGTELGCDPSTESSFVVLSNQGYLPKPIVTRCADNALDASQFFAAMVTNVDGTGIDAKQMHLASWDADAGTYRRYATAGTPSGEMAVNVAPEFCLGCHGGTQKLDTWAPIMNEMSSPWANWNAHPGFVSLEFDELLDPTFADDATYRDLTRDGLLDSAASLEPIVRAGQQRVTNARLKQRTVDADLTRALELVRPLFCDESTNYVSEVHRSGELRTHALVDDAIRNLYRSADVDGPWSWLADTRIQLPPPATNEAPVTLIPVRGESTIGIELGLVARGVLQPIDALRVRALDWKHPVQSSFRCDLYQQGAQRIAAGVLDGQTAITVEDLVPAVFAEIMTVGGVPFAPVAPGAVLAIADADAAARAQVAAGSWSGFEVSLTGFGDLLESHVASYEAAPMRSALAAERDLRACQIAKDPTAPLFDLECPTP